MTPFVARHKYVHGLLLVLAFVPEDQGISAICVGEGGQITRVEPDDLTVVRGDPAVFPVDFQEQAIGVPA